MSKFTTPSRLPRAFREEPPTEFHRFMEERLAAMKAATRLLAGRNGSRLLNRLAEDLATEDHLRPSTRRAAEQLSVRLDPVGEGWKELLNLHDFNGSSPEVLELELLIRDYREALAQATTDHPPASRSRQRA